MTSASDPCTVAWLRAERFQTASLPCWDIVARGVGYSTVYCFCAQETERLVSAEGIPSPSAHHEEDVLLSGSEARVTRGLLKQLAEPRCWQGDCMWSELQHTKDRSPENPQSCLQGERTRSTEASSTPSREVEQQRLEEAVRGPARPRATGGLGRGGERRAGPPARVLPVGGHPSQRCWDVFPQW